MAGLLDTGGAEDYTVRDLPGVLLAGRSGQSVTSRRVLTSLGMNHKWGTGKHSAGRRGISKNDHVRVLLEYIRARAICSRIARTIQRISKAGQKQLLLSMKNRKVVYTMIDNFYCGLCKRTRSMLMHKSRTGSGLEILTILTLGRTQSSPLPRANSIEQFEDGISYPQNASFSACSIFLEVW